MVSNDQMKVSNHMRISHNIKVEVDLLSRKFPCSLCKYTTRNMDELKNHLIREHNKDKYNWMVEEIEAEYACDECEIKYSRKSELEDHLNKIHGGDGSDKVNKASLEGKKWSCISCEMVFKTEIEYQEHFNIEHCTKNVVEVDGIKEEESISHQEVKNDFFEMELIPKNSSNDSKTGVIFRGDSKEYDEAQSKLEKILSKPNAQYSID